MEKGWEFIFASNDLIRIDIVKSKLEENDIKSVSVDKRSSSMISVGEIEVYVRVEDAILAKIILQQIAF